MALTHLRRAHRHRQGDQQGHSKFRRIVIAGNSKDFCYPCGACRQFLYEFSPDMEVICLNRAREAKRMTLRELMPCGFDSTFL